MANFSTEFPIDSKKTVEEVVQVAWDWVTGSPHTKIPKTALHAIPVDGELTIAEGFEQVTIATAKLPDFEIGGLRYVRTEDSLEWTTSIVALKTADKHLLSLQVLCAALNTAVRLPPPKKPYFIRQALSELGGGSDGAIPVTDKPFRLSEGEEAVAAALMLGTASNKLPIVYVSASFKGGHLVNPDDLAKFVSGMAHVVVEPSRGFSYKVKALTRAKNVFGGTVGVYWPESDARKAYFLDDETPNSRALQLEIAKDIRVALSNRRQRTACTWSHLKETVARKRFEQLKVAGSAELKEYVDAFDAELAAKDVRIQEAEQEIARLNSDVRRLAVPDLGIGAGLLRRGVEQDLYEHEIADIVIDALGESLRSARQASRRQHVLTDLLAANPQSGERQKLEDEMKTLFRAYRDMDARTRNALARLGFDLSEDGKHFKAIYHGDGRYTFSLPKTSSDHRAGKNIASDINNALF